MESIPSGASLRIQIGQRPRGEGRFAPSVFSIGSILGADVKQRTLKFSFLFRPGGGGEPGGLGVEFT